MAAAYAALVSVLNNLEDIQNDRRHSFSFDNNQIQSLHGSVSFLIDFMERYHANSSHLESQITRAAHDAEQLIESHVKNQILAGKYASASPPPDLQRVIEGVDSVRREAAEVQKSGLKVKQLTHSAAATFISEKNINSMVGFNDVLLQLMDLLTGEPSSLQVIPIVGMAGIGKTTLARNVFEHSLVVQHFDVCVWVTISQQYDVRQILSKLLSGQGKSNVEEDDKYLGEQLHKSLYNRRYLIILDDMWSVEAWDEIRLFFPDTRDGSRMVVTTRQSDVAQNLDNSSCNISLGFLDDDKSWDLFCQKAFAGQGCPPELEDVGKEIAKKCKGLPLAIVVVAGHLGKSPTTQEYWEKVSYNMNSVFNSEESKHVFDILSFSYSHLPICLKPCFVYMGRFQEDEEILASHLIKSWIAEGFLKPCKGNNNWEEIAEDYLKDLIDRNLILVKRRLTQGQIILVGIHDLLRELCKKVAEKEMFFGTPRDICREPVFATEKKVPKKNPRPKHFGRGPQVKSCSWREGPFELRLMRVMAMSEEIRFEGYEAFLEADLQHVNLRFLKYNGYYYSSDRSVHLPSSISRLWNLKSLIIEIGSGGSFIAPYEIWEMLQLRHLESTGIHLPDPLPTELSDDLVIMPNLQTLGHVINLKLSEEVCRRILNVKELRLTYSDDVRSCYCPHNLVYLSKLESLECRFPADSAWPEFALSLTFPSTVKRLCLSGSRLDWGEMAMLVGSLPHLQSLGLEEKSVVGSEWSPVEGKFLRLKCLKVSDCDDLVCWNADSSDFPVLEDLLLEGLGGLDEFPSGIGEIATLECITLKGCSVSLAVSAMRMVVEQEEEGNESIKLHVFFGDEEKERFNRRVQQASLRSKNLQVLTEEQRRW